MSDEILSKRQSNWNNKHDGIANAAAKLFTTHGYEGVNMDQVASAAKVSKATVYRHFDSKDDLYVHIIERLCDQADQRILPIDFDQPVAALTMMGMAYFRRFSHPQIRALTQTVSSSSRNFPMVGDLFWRTGPGFGFDVIKKILAKLKQNCPHISVDVELAAWMFFGAITGRQLIEMICHKNELIDETIMLSRAETIVDVFLKGIGYDPT